MKQYRVTGWINLRVQVNEVIEADNEKIALNNIYHSYPNPRDYHLRVHEAIDEVN